MNKTIIFTILFVFILLPTGFTQNSASQVQRSQEILEKEQALRKKLEEPEKFYIKKIILERVTLLSKEEIEDITAPFQKHWLTSEQIEQLLSLIKEAYKQKGYLKDLPELAFQIQNKELIIQVAE